MRIGQNKLGRAALFLWLSALSASVLLATPSAAHAEEAAAPSLEVETDAAPHPFVGYALSVDLVGIPFGEYRLSFDFAAVRWFNTEASIGWTRDGKGDHGPNFALRFSITPMGRGIDGFFIGAGGDLVLKQDMLHGRASVIMETGYNFVWRSMMISLSAGAARVWDFDGNERWSPIVRLRIGWASLR